MFKSVNTLMQKASNVGYCDIKMTIKDSLRFDEHVFCTHKKTNFFVTYLGVPRKINEHIVEVKELNIPH